MNRKQRRAFDASAQWYRLDGSRDYGTSKELLDLDGLTILVDVFRSGAPTLDHISDEDIFNAGMALIRHGYLDVFVKFTSTGIQSRIVPMIPGIGTFDDYLERNIH